MSRAVLILDSIDQFRKAHNWIGKAPNGTRVEFKAPKRTLPQNDRFWAMLTDIAQQKTYHTLKLTTEDWKLLFLDALKREVRIVPNLDGTGFVNLSKSSSDLSKDEMSDLMEIIAAWGASNGVIFTDPEFSSRANGSGRPLSAAKPLAGASPVSASASNMEKA